MGTFLGILVVLNAILGAFNLLPVPPLDGASVLGLVLPPEAHQRFKDSIGSGGIGALLFLVVLLFFGRLFVVPIFNGIVALLYR